MLPNSFYKVSITLMSKPDNNITRPKDAKVIPNKICENQVEKYRKRKMHHNKTGLVPVI